MSGVTRNVAALVNTIVDLMKTADVEEEKIEQMRPKLSEIVDDFAGRLDACEKLIDDQKNLTTLLLQKIGGLEKKLKQSVISDRRRQYNLVRSNVLCRTKGNIGDIQKFIANAVELGGGPKTTQKSISVVEISPPAGKVRENKIFRVALAEGQKKNLFTGLTKADLGDVSQTIRIDNECPAFLMDAKRKMDRISYTLRKQFKESHHTRVKVAISGLKLRLRIKDKNNPSWINIDDVKASDYFNCPVFFGADEVPSTGIPLVKDFYKETLESMD